MHTLHISCLQSGDDAAAADCNIPENEVSDLINLPHDMQTTVLEAEMTQPVVRYVVSTCYKCSVCYMGEKKTSYFLSLLNINFNAFNV